MRAEDSFDLIALKTIAGAVHYILTRYDQKEIGEYEWNQLASYLKIGIKTVHCVESSPRGFVLTTKELKFKYVHSDFHGKRVVEIVWRD
jgi:hypothetical protein